MAESGDSLVQQVFNGLKTIPPARMISFVLTIGLVVGGLAAPGSAETSTLDGPNPAIWLSDPEGDEGDNGIERGDQVAGSSGRALLNDNGATIIVEATGLEPGHAYTMWVVYFNDQTECEDREAVWPDATARI